MQRVYWFFYDKYSFSNFHAFCFLLPCLPTHTALSAHRPKPGVDIISLCPAQRFSHSWTGEHLCDSALCLWHSLTAGLVTICLGKPQAWSISTGTAIQAQSKSGHKAGILPYLRGPASCPCFSHTKKFIYVAPPFLNINISLFSLAESC